MTGAESPPPTTPAPSGDRTGRLLADRYLLEAEIGRGTAGVVHRAVDKILNRVVAVKILNRRSDLLDRDRLLQEARAAAALSHPNIVGIHDAGEYQEMPYLVMEMVEGPNLRQVGALDWEGVARLGSEILDALDHAHGRGLIHRDIKPENILMEPVDGRHRARLADFSVSRLGARQTATLEGAIVGTPWYLAPEQALGEAIDGRVDLYALGAVLYELASGRPPFTGSDVLVIIAEHLHAPVVPPRTWRSDVPPMLEAFILRLLAKRPEDRYASAQVARQALAAVTFNTEDPAQSSPASPSPMLLSQLARGRLVGRRTELDRLNELWAETLSGRGQMVVLSGEPGVGKSRLAQEMLVQARLGGARVLRGGSYEFEATTPYLPFVEALRGWITETDDAGLQAATADIAPDLARLAPELAARLGPFPERPALTPGEERMRLYNAVGRLFRRLAGKGLVVFLDDLHWADQGSLALVHSLLRQIIDAPILILGAYREVELDRSHPLAGALVEWNRERLVTRLALGRLSATETRTFLATLFGQATVGEAFARAIHKETEGNPFFLEEVVKALIEQGQIYRSGNEWLSDTAENLIIPQSVKEAIGRRLDRLGPTCLEVLHLAAALGKIFTFEELAAASGRTEDELLDALDEAVRAQLIRSHTGESFAFTHDKIREVLYGESNPVRRRRQHLKILSALEAVHARDLGPRVTDLAHHAVLAGDLDKGFRYSMAAVERAEKVYAHDEARRYADQARECAEALADRERIVAAYRARSHVEFHSGAAAAAAAALVSALPYVDEERKRNGIAITIGQHYASIGDARGLPHIEAVLARLDREVEPDQAARALAVRARYHHYQLEHRLAVDILEEARRYAAVRNKPDTMTTITAFLAGAYQNLGDFHASIRLAVEAVEFGRAHDYPIAVALGHEFQGEALALLGRVGEAVEQAAILRTIGLQLGARDRLAWADFIDTYAHFFAGNLHAALAAGRHGLAMAEQIGELRVAALIAGYVAAVLAELGEDDEWSAMADRGHQLVEAAGQRWMSILFTYNIALAQLTRGRVADAALTLTAPGLDDTGDNLIARLIGLPVRSEFECRFGNYEAALAHADSLVEIAAAADAEYSLGVGHRMRAAALFGLGRLDEANAAVAASIARHERQAHNLQLAHALALRADLTDACRAASTPEAREDDILARSAAADREESTRLHEACKSRTATSA